MEHGTLHANRYHTSRVRNVHKELHDFRDLDKGFMRDFVLALGMNTCGHWASVYACVRVSTACIAPLRGRSSGMWWSLEQITAQAPDG
jgi:hypothetical protein